MITIGTKRIDVILAGVLLILAVAGSGTAQARSCQPTSTAVACRPGTVCIRIHLIDIRKSKQVCNTVATAVEEANDIYESWGMSFRYDPKVDYEELSGALLDDECTLGVAANKVSSYKTQGSSPPCDYAPQSIARHQTAAMRAGKLVLFSVNGRSPVWDDAAKRYVVAPLNVFYSSGSAGYVVLPPHADNGAGALAHEMGHYFHLHHTHAGEYSPVTLSLKVCDLVKAGMDPNEAYRVLTDGDRGSVKDTPPDPGEAFYQKDGTPGCAAPATRKLTVTCAVTEGGATTVKDFAITIAPELSNLMSYHAQSCAGVRTPTLSFGQGLDVLNALAWNRRELVGGSRWSGTLPAFWNDVNGQHWISLTRGDGGVRYRALVTGEGEAFWDASNSYSLEGNDNAGFQTPVVHDGTRVHFFQTTAGFVKHKYYEGGDWLPNDADWNTLSVFQEVAGTIVAVPTGLGQFRIFARAADDSLLTKRWSERGSWIPNGTAWERLGGCIKGDPAVTASGGRVDVVVRGCNDAVWHKSFQSGAWSPSQDGFTSIGGSIRGEPAAVFRPGLNKSLDIVARGTDGALWYKALRIARSTEWWPSTDGWITLGGKFTGSPSIASHDVGAVDIVGRGTDGSLHHKRCTSESNWCGTDEWYPSKTQWTDMGFAPVPSGSPLSTSSPVIVSPEKGTLRIYGLDAWGGLYSTEWKAPRTVTNWSDWQFHGRW